VEERKPNVPDAFRKAVEFLDGRKVPYVVIGGLAASVQGQPRYTDDADLLVTVPSHGVWRLAEEARKAGFDVDPHFAELHWRSSGFIRLWLGPVGDQVAVDLMACKTEFLREASWRAQPIVLMGKRVPVATSEDMILFKLAAYRDKDVMDLIAIARRHEGKLDLAYLRKWAAWLPLQNECFREMPALLELLLAKKPMPPGKSS
jgi:predicted nucleotidyltransferase